MYIVYLNMNSDITGMYGHISIPHDDPILLNEWRVTECEWMVPGTFNDG